MALYLDSAIISEAQAAQEWGWVKGITTNPTLLAKSNLSPEETLKRLAELSAGPVFYQLTSSGFDEMIAEGRTAYKVIGPQTVLKVPASLVGFRVVASLSEGIPCAVTAIYSASQAAVAKEAGAQYAIAYVSRASKLLGDGLSLIREMASLVKGSHTEILAASIKSREEAVASLEAGADHLTLPLAMLQSMANHELSMQTIFEFAKGGRGLTPHS